MEAAEVLLARMIALHAAASGWAGVSSITARNDTILAAALEFEKWLLRPPAEWEQAALDGGGF